MAECSRFERLEEFILTAFVINEGCEHQSFVIKPESLLKAVDFHTKKDNQSKKATYLWDADDASDLEDDEEFIPTEGGGEESEEEEEEEQSEEEE